MECLNRFKAKMERIGGDMRNEKIFNSRMFLKETFADDSSYILGIYFWQHGKNKPEDYADDTPIEIRLYNRTYSEANGYTVKFQTQYDTPVIVGDILYDSLNDEFYLCRESFDLNTVHYKGKLVLCNWVLKWQDKDGNIWEYPCYDINSTQYNSGETPNRQYTVGTSQHLLHLPSDENTVALSTPKRFFLDKNMDNPTVFIVTQNDTTSYNIGKKGIVRITVIQHVRDYKKDRIDLGICDYMDIEDVIVPAVGTSIYSVIECKSKVIKSGGDKKLFTGKFYDTNGNDITDSMTSKWTIISSFSSELEVDESSNEIRIGINNDDYIDEDFKLVFSDSFGNYPSEILISIDSLL